MDATTSATTWPALSLQAQIELIFNVNHCHHAHAHVHLHVHHYCTSLTYFCNTRHPFRFSVSVAQQLRGLKLELLCHELARKQASLFNSRVMRFAYSPVANNVDYAALQRRPSGLHVSGIRKATYSRQVLAFGSSFWCVSCRCWSRSSQRESRLHQHTLPGKKVYHDDGHHDDDKRGDSDGGDGHRYFFF